MHNPNLHFFFTVHTTESSFPTIVSPSSTLNLYIVCLPTDDLLEFPPLYTHWIAKGDGEGEGGSEELVVSWHNYRPAVLQFVELSTASPWIMRMRWGFFVQWLLYPHKHDLVPGSVRIKWIDCPKSWIRVIPGFSWTEKQKKRVTCFSVQKGE